MWLVRELVKLVVRVIVITVATVALAGVLALVSAGSFMHDARVLSLVFGCMLFAMGGIGRGSNVERFADRGVMQAAWGTIPGFDALQSHPEEPHLAAGPALVLSGIALIAIGIAVF
jgi:hypothetical protein